MKKLFAVVLAVSLVSVGSAAAASDLGRGKPAQERFLVGFAGAPGASERALVARNGGEVVHDLSNIDALAVRMPAQAAAGLARNPSVSYVEADEVRTAMSLADAELAPALDNGLYGLVTTRTTSAHSAGWSGLGVRACVADSGIDYSHPDIAPNYKGGIDEVSNDFDPTWGGDVNETHGTHVAGTVLGVQGNGQGVYGAAPRADLYYARVLGYNRVTGNVSGSSSDIMAGVRWLVETANCKVVNMSLGGGRAMKSEQRFYADMDKKGALIVAASGNDSATAVSYPAAYSTVLSVGAVDVNNQHASFSNTGTGLDMSAPGVLVLSSYPVGTGSESRVTQGGTSYRSSGLEYAGRTSASGVSGTLVSCGLADSTTSCGGAAPGFVALIQRGTISFADKVKNATAQGAAAAILYNNAPGEFAGTLGTSGTWIPAVSVSDTSGSSLKNALGASATVVNMASSWEHSDGTSMATPHVSGIAALVFQSHPSWTDDQVEDRLKASAQNLGVAGYDTTFGYGLVDAQAATAP